MKYVPSRRSDPTGLFTLRKRVASRIRGLVREFGKELQEYLETEWIPSVKQEAALQVVTNASYFSGLIESLKAWTNKKLDAMLKKALKSKTFGSWWTEALRVAYSRGVVSAYSDLKALNRVVTPVPFEALASEFAKSVAVRKLAEETLPLIVSAAGDELGLTTSRSVVGLVRQAGSLALEHASARQIASELVETALKGLGASTTRVMQTEMTRAFSWGKLDGAKTLGVKDVVVYAEIHGINDTRRCQRCQDLDGTVWTLDQARAIIPVHPACRCSFVVVSEERYERQERMRLSLLTSVLSQL